MRQLQALHTFVGRRLAEARRQAGLTQQQVSTALGISRSHVTQIERGVKSPSLDVLSRWAQLCRVPLSQVFDSAEAEIEPAALLDSR